MCSWSINRQSCMNYLLFVALTVLKILLECYYFVDFCVFDFIYHNVSLEATGCAKDRHYCGGNPYRSCVSISAWQQRISVGCLWPVVLFLVGRLLYISFAMSWEVSLVGRNTITHGGWSVLLHKRWTSNCRKLRMLFAVRFDSVPFGYRPRTGS